MRTPPGRASVTFAALTTGEHCFRVRTASGVLGPTLNETVFFTANPNLLGQGSACKGAPRATTRSVIVGSTVPSATPSSKARSAEVVAVSGPSMARPTLTCSCLPDDVTAVVLELHATVAPCHEAEFEQDRCVVRRVGLPRSTTTSVTLTVRGLLTGPHAFRGRVISSNDGAGPWSAEVDFHAGRPSAGQPHVALRRVAPEAVEATWLGSLGSGDQVVWERDRAVLLRSAPGATSCVFGGLLPGIHTIRAMVGASEDA